MSVTTVETGRSVLSEGCLCEGLVVEWPDMEGRLRFLRGCLVCCCLETDESVPECLRGDQKSAGR